MTSTPQPPQGVEYVPTPVEPSPSSDGGAGKVISILVIIFVVALLIICCVMVALFTLVGTSMMAIDGTARNTGRYAPEQRGGPQDDYRFDGMDEFRDFDFDFEYDSDFPVDPLDRVDPDGLDMSDALAYDFEGFSTTLASRLPGNIATAFDGEERELVERIIRMDERASNNLQQALVEARAAESSEEMLDHLDEAYRIASGVAEAYSQIDDDEATPDWFDDTLEAMEEKWEHGENIMLSIIHPQGHDFSTLLEENNHMVRTNEEASRALLEVAG